jgi:pyruvate formate lyase activating enzyme
MHGKHYNVKQLEKIVKQNKTCCDAVVLTGGEPTLQDTGCEDVFKIAREYKLATMLNTNGVNTSAILRLIEQNLVDKIAMDVKAPLNVLDYQEQCGVKDRYLSANIANTLHLINKLEVPLELRTTVVGGTYSDEPHIYKLIDDIAKLTSEYHLQEFQDDNILDPKLRGKIVGREKLLEFAHYAKSKGIKKVIVKTKLNGYEEIK